MYIYTKIEKKKEKCYQQSYRDTLTWDKIEDISKHL